MKKISFIALLGLVLLTLAGCVSVGPECKCKTKTIDLHVRSTDWLWDNEFQRFFYHIDRSDITASIYDTGTWVFTREYNHGTSKAYQVALPESTFKTETTNTGTVAYIEHIDYAIGIGWVEVTYTISDYVYPEEGGQLVSPGEMWFHLQINY